MLGSSNIIIVADPSSKALDNFLDQTRYISDLGKQHNCFYDPLGPGPLGNTVHGT